MTTETTGAAAATEPLNLVLEAEGVAEFQVAWQDLLDAVTKSMSSKGVDGE